MTRRIPLALGLAATALVAVIVVACSDPPKPIVKHVEPVVVEPPPTRKPVKPRVPHHAAHEHEHGAHPHPDGGHHHHPHPHPHLEDNPNGHHHPY